MHIYLKLALILILSFVSLKAKAQSQLKKGTFALRINTLGVEYAKQDSFFIAINSDFENPVKVSNLDTLELPVGEHSLTIFQKYYRDVTFIQTIKEEELYERIVYINRFENPDKQKTESSYPRYYWQLAAFVLTDDSTEVFYYGKSLGYRIAVFDSITQSIQLKGIANDGTKFSKRFDTGKTFNVMEIYYRPDKNTLRRKSVIPGAAQIYKREYAKAGIFIAAAIATAASSLYFQNKYTKTHNDFMQLERAYQRENDPVEAYELANEVERKQDQSNSAFRTRNYFMTGFAAVYLANIVDSFLKPRIGYRTNEIEFDPYLDFNKQAVFMNFKITKKF
ncbi:MAG: DUF5683 domain-containing protein [Gracilimonas sp.]